MELEQLKNMLATAVLVLFFVLLAINRWGTYKRKKSGKDDDDTEWL
ncbi:MAG TPA: hypothetical protein VGC08_09030 [Pedobacter sp.]